MYEQQQIISQESGQVYIVVSPFHSDSVDARNCHTIVANELVVSLAKKRGKTVAFLDFGTSYYTPTCFSFSCVEKEGVSHGSSSSSSSRPNTPSTPSSSSSSTTESEETDDLFEDDYQLVQQYVPLPEAPKGFPYLLLLSLWLNYLCSRYDEVIIGERLHDEDPDGTRMNAMKFFLDNAKSVLVVTTFSQDSRLLYNQMHAQLTEVRHKMIVSYSHMS